MTLSARRLLRSRLPETLLLSALTVVLFLVTSSKAADPPKELTKQDIAALQAKYEADLAAAKKDALDKRFSPDFYTRAADYAAKGTAALQAGRLLEAKEAFTKAR